MSRAQDDIVPERVWQGGGGRKQKKSCGFSWLFLLLENFREALIGWDDAVILGFISLDIFLKCRLLRQIFLGIPWITNADLPAAVLIPGPG